MADLPDATVDRLLERHMEVLRSFVHLRLGRLIRTKESESDIVQSVCRNVLDDRGAFEYRGETSFRQWLLRRAEHKIVDRGRFYRREKRESVREEPLDPRAANEDGEGEVATLFTPSRHAAGREELERVERAFRELPAPYREVVVLARIVGLSHEAIAARLGRTNGAVRKMLSRALARLAVLLDDD